MTPWNREQEARQPGGRVREYDLEQEGVRQLNLQALAGGEANATAPERPNWLKRVRDWLGRRRDEGEAVIGAHSPAIYTGPVSSAGAGSNIGNMVGAPVATPLGITGNAGGMAGDLVSGVRAAINAYRAVQTLRNQGTDPAERALAGNQLRSALIDGPTIMADLGAQSTNVAGLSAVSSFLSAPVQALVAARAGWRAYRASKHEAAIQSIVREKAAAAPPAFHKRTKPRKELEEYIQNRIPGIEKKNPTLKFIRAQMNKRKRRNVIGGIGAAIGGTGAALLGAGALGVTALSPIGWGLGTLGAVVGLGLGAHKLWRWGSKKWRGTLGKEREDHTNAIHAALQDRHSGPLLEAANDAGESTGTAPKVTPEEAKKILKAMGIPEHLAKAERGGRSYLKEKLLSW